MRFLSIIGLACTLVPQRFFGTKGILINMFVKNVLAALLLFGLAGLAHALEGYAVDPETGLRMERYRAPVPADVPGGVTLSNESAAQMHGAGDIIFIDVYPPKGLGPDPLDGFWVTNEKRSTIPGGVWLPEVGRGTLDAQAEDYFKRNLARLTEGELSRKVAFYCTADCWQSWNAARRAILWHYPIVYWYPEGTDGWRDTGGDQVPATAVNFLHSRDVELAPLQSR